MSRKQHFYNFLYKIDPKYFLILKEKHVSNFLFDTVTDEKLPLLSSSMASKNSIK